MSKFQIFIPIAKVNRDQRTVGGWATTEKVDKQDEIVDYEASKKAFDDWHGNIREMHEPKAVGKAISVQEDDENKRIYVTAKISKGAQDTWEKIKDGTLTGFSIGGQTIDKQVVLVKDDATNDHKQITRITKYKLNELSLVDNPANPEAQFELVKSVSGQLQQTPVIEDDVTKSNTIRKYNGGEYQTMALSQKTLVKIGTLVKTLEGLVKQDWEDPNAEVGAAKKTPNQTTEGTEVAKGEDWEDPNPEVGGAKKTPQVTTEGKEVDESERVGKADMATESDLQTQDPDGSDAAPVTKLYKQNDKGEYEEVTPEEAKKMLKADMKTESDLQTQDEDGSDAAPVKKARKQVDEEDENDTEKQNDEDEKETIKTHKRHYRKQDEDENVEKVHEEGHEDETEKAYEDEDETTKTRKVRKVKKTRKQAEEDEMDKVEDGDEDVEKQEDEDDEKVSKTVLSELRKITKRLDKIETTPLPRKYHKIEKGGPNGNAEAELIQKTTDEVQKATEERNRTGKPCSPEIEKKRDWLINKSFDTKFGTGELRKV